MDNISFAKNMAGWSQKDQPVSPPESNAAVEYDKAPDADELNFDAMLGHAKMLVDNAFKELEHCYAIKAKKEIHDARIHLSLVKNLLKSIL